MSAPTPTPDEGSPFFGWLTATHWGCCSWPTAAVVPAWLIGVPLGGSAEMRFHRGVDRAGLEPTE